MDSGPRENALWGVLRGEQPAVASLYSLMVLMYIPWAMVGPAAAFFAMEDIGMTSQEVGDMMSVQAVVQVAAAWGIGRLSDAVGRRVCILGSFAAACTGVGMLAFAKTKVEVWIASLVIGGLAAFYPISDAYILDAVPVEDRAAYTGLYGAALALSFTIGSGMSAVLLHLAVPRRSLLLLGAVLSAAAIVFGALRLHESFSSQKRRPILEDLGEQADWAVVGSGLLCVWACNFLYGMGDAMMITYPFIISDLYGWTDTHFAMAMGSVGVCAGIVMVFAFPVLAARLGASCTLGFGCLAGALAYACFPQDPAVHIGGLGGFMLAIALFGPSVPLVVGMFAGERHLGFASGVGGAARSVANIISPLLAGRLYERHGPPYLYLGSGFFLAAACAAVGVHLSPTRERGETQKLNKV